MSRRTPIATLLRVGDLQGAVARGAVAKALREHAEAVQAHDRATADLASAGLAGGTRQAVEATTQVRLWRAEAVTSAGAAVEEAVGTRDQALAAWTATRRQHRLFESLAARKHEAARLARERVEQGLADELSGRRP